MYKKYCLIASILLIIPLFTTSMEVEEEEEEEQQRTHILEMITGRSFFQIHIQTNDNRTFIFPSNHPLFSQSTFFRAMIEGGFKEKGTKANPISLQSIDSNQLEFIVKFIKIKTDPKKLKRYLQDLNIDDLNQLIVASNFLGVKEALKFVVPHLVKQLQDPDMLNAWLQVGGQAMEGTGEGG